MAEKDPHSFHEKLRYVRRLLFIFFQHYFFLLSPFYCFVCSNYIILFLTPILFCFPSFLPSFFLFSLCIGFGRVEPRRRWRRCGTASEPKSLKGVPSRSLFFIFILLYV